MIAWRSVTSHWIPRSRRSVAAPAAISRTCSSRGDRAVLSAANLVLSGLRSRSPLVEHACAVLIWARTRSLDGLISAIDDVLLPVGEAQFQVEEESLVTLTQQRAVTFAMSGLMTVMFVSLVRVASFRAYYDTFEGTLVLLVAVAMFFAPHRHARTHRPHGSMDSMGSPPGAGAGAAPAWLKRSHTRFSQCLRLAPGSAELSAGRLHSEDARAWRRMSHLRGYATRGSALERVAIRAPLLRRFRRSSTSNSLLGQANSDDSSTSFLARTGGRHLDELRTAPRRRGGWQGADRRMAGATLGCGACSRC